jgi:hypothetical protein
LTVASVLRRAIERKLHPRRPAPEPSEDALQLDSAMVGAVVLARLVDDPALAQRLLAAARAQPPAPPPTPLSLEEVRAFALAAGADDAGWVSLDHPDLAEERPHVLAAMPGARSLVVLSQQVVQLTRRCEAATG